MKILRAGAVRLSYWRVGQCTPVHYGDIYCKILYVPVGCSGELLIFS